VILQRRYGQIEKIKSCIKTTNQLQSKHNGGKMKFTPEQLENKMYKSGGMIEDRITAHRRWSVTHYLVFVHDKKYYGTTYDAPATEYQDCDPWGYETEIECEEVTPVQRSFTVYIPVVQE
jgi:hypothetical protein